MESFCTSICVVECKATSLLATTLCLTNLFGIGVFHFPHSMLLARLTGTAIGL